jgi:hypothetical protein
VLRVQSARNMNASNERCTSGMLLSSQRSASVKKSQQIRNLTPVSRSILSQLGLFQLEQLEFLCENPGEVRILTQKFQFESPDNRRNDS